MAALLTRHHPAQRALVLPLCLALSGFGGDDGAREGWKLKNSTINRWVLKYAPELDKRIRFHLKSTNDSWRVDETYIEIKGKWKYLGSAVDSEGNTLDFMRSC